MKIQPEFQCKSFGELSTAELYAILAARNTVFVVEQHCNYLDTDGIDLHSFHLCAWSEGQLVAYARIIPPGISGVQPSIGRVLVLPEFRRYGLGIILMEKAIQITREKYPSHPIHISAQRYLEEFYTRLGFQADGHYYLEDNIPHMGMDLPVPTQ